MNSQELEELREMLAIQRELARQRLRTSVAEAWVDDVKQKMAVNRAVYCAGYGIDPRPYAEPPSASVSTASKVGKWALIAAAVAGGGVPAGLGTYFLSRPTEESSAAATQAERDKWEFGLLPPAQTEQVQP